jgi:hypothetical protein
MSEGTQVQTSSQAKEQIQKGLTIKWIRSHRDDNNDKEWDIVAWSDGSFFLYDNASANFLTEIYDGSNPQIGHVFQTDIGSVVCVPPVSEIETYDDLDSFHRSLPDYLFENTEVDGLTD